MRGLYLKRLSEGKQQRLSQESENAIMPESNSGFNVERVANITEILGIPIDLVHVGLGMWQGAFPVEPEHALCWLQDFNHSNRNEILRNIKAMADEMRSGNFHLTHQGIAFDAEPNLLDGQNRLAAVVEADVPVNMLVSVYDGRQSIGGVDIGIKRTWCGSRKILFGEEVPALYSGVLRVFINGPGANYVVPHSVMDRVFEATREELQFLDDVFPQPIRGIRRAPVLSAVLRAACYGFDRDKLGRFCHVLTTSHASDAAPEESTIIALRNFLVGTMGASSGKQSQDEVFLKTQWAISKYWQTKSYNKVMAAPSDLFPLSPRMQAVVRGESPA